MIKTTVPCKFQLFWGTSQPRMFWLRVSSTQTLDWAAIERNQIYEPTVGRWDDTWKITSRYLGVYKQTAQIISARFHFTKLKWSLAFSYLIFY